MIFSTLRKTRGILGGLALTALLSTPAFACGDPADMTHFGTIAAIDTEAMTVTLVDAQSGDKLVFAVTADQIKAVKQDARVAIHYSEADGKLTAQEIRI